MLAGLRLLDDGAGAEGLCAAVEAEVDGVASVFRVLRVLVWHFEAQHSGGSGSGSGRCGWGLCSLARPNQNSNFEITRVTTTILQ